jgi:hypothetical protein
LAALGGAAPIEPLLELMCALDGTDDDWYVADFPTIAACIGPSAFSALEAFARNPRRPDASRSAVVLGMQRVVQRHTETRERMVSFLVEQIECCRPDDECTNASLLIAAVELKVVEAASAIERAFANDILDVSFAGDWETVRRELGVEGLGLQMPATPRHSIRDFQRTMALRRLAIGVFSDGELDQAALDTYVSSMMEEFAASPEGQTVAADYGDLGWTSLFLELGATYCGVTADSMEKAQVSEILFELFPRKVSTEPSSAECIVRELQAFWNFVRRVLACPGAGGICEWLDDASVGKLEKALGDVSRFGPAKSFFMQGRAAGFDMSSELGIEAYRTFYNDRLAAPDSTHDQDPRVPQSADALRKWKKKRAKQLAALKKARKASR